MYTLDRKLLIALVIPTMRHGVSIIEVPLLALGSDQLAKAACVDKNVEAWHVDKFRGQSSTELKQRPVCVTKEERDKLSIILYMLSRKLTAKSD